MKNNISKIVAIFIALVFAVGGFFYFTSKDIDTKNDVTEETAIVQIFDIIVTLDGNTDTYQVEIGTDSLFAILKTMNGKLPNFSFAYSESEYGAFVTSVNGYEVDNTKEFWSISVNGESAMVGVSDLYPVEGDAISFVVEAFE